MDKPTDGLREFLDYGYIPHAWVQIELVQLIQPLADDLLQLLLVKNLYENLLVF
jgi:hypothetical protein